METRNVVRGLTLGSLLVLSIAAGGCTRQEDPEPAPTGPVEETVPVTAETPESDGEILLVQDEMPVAYIDLGSSHGLRQGLLFDVFGPASEEPKGRIKVLKVEEEMSSATILEPTNPIEKGDRIASPLFSKRGEQVFVLLGEMVNPTLGRQEILERIVKAGGRVGETVTPETDHVVAGKDAELSPGFDKALQLGIGMLREETLLRYLSD